MVSTRNARATESVAAAVSLTQRVTQILKMYVNIYDEAATLCRPMSRCDTATSQGDTSLGVASQGDMSTPSAQRDSGAAKKEAHELSVAEGVREAPRNAEVSESEREREN